MMKLEGKQAAVILASFNFVSSLGERCLEVSCLVIYRNCQEKARSPYCFVVIYAEKERRVSLES